MPLVTVEQRAIHSAGRRLLPFLFVLYVFNFLDRTNVSIAALQMNGELRFDPAVFGFGSGIFFLGYALFEVPSNLILARVGARRWIARIMVTWGALATAMVFVRTPQQFYTVRFLLGLAEAGFYPGVLYYLSQWFPQAHRARATARFAIAIPLSQAVSGFLGSALLGLSGVAQLSGWQWLFLVEGLPSIALGVVTWIYLTDRPADATWLRDDERSWLTAAIATEHAQVSGSDPVSPGRALLSGLTWALMIPYLAYYTLNNAYIFWAPQLIRQALGSSDSATSLVAASIALVAAVAFVLSAVHSDRTGERCHHVAAGLAVSTLGCAAAACAPSPALRVVALALIPIGGSIIVPAFWCLPSMLYSGTTAAAAIGLINAVGSTGGFLGPNVVGLVRRATGTDVAAFAGLAAFGAIGIGVSLWLRGTGRFHVARPGQDGADAQGNSRPVART